MTDQTNEERLQIENKKLRASIEIYAQQCMELSRFARKYEQLENQMQEMMNRHSAIDKKIEKICESLNIEESDLY